MSDFVIENGVLVQYTGNDEIVTIPDTVTAIGGRRESWRTIGAFEDCNAITEVTIPDSVTSIGYSAFSGCEKLKSVTIPDSVTSIGYSAFSRCNNLTSVTIPDSVTSIGYRAFGDCKSLTSVTIPDSVTSIAAWAFAGCASLTSVEIPNSVTSIGGEAFKACTGLTSVMIPDSVKLIEESAFAGCTGLKDVTIMDDVTEIEKEAFGDCSSLKSLRLPQCRLTLGKDTFKNCANITEIYALDPAVFADKKKLLMACIEAFINKPSPIESERGKAHAAWIKKNADACKTLALTHDDFMSFICTNGLLPSELIDPWLEAARKKKKRKIVEVLDAYKECAPKTPSKKREGNPLKGLQFCMSGRFKEISHFIDWEVKEPNECFRDRKSLSDYLSSKGATLADQVTKKTDYLIVEDVDEESEKTKKAVAYGVKIIDWNSFLRMTNLYVNGCIIKNHHLLLYIDRDAEKVVVPEGVTTIEWRAFLECTKLKEIVLPESLIKIERYALAKCTALTHINIPKKLKKVEDYAFDRCGSIETPTGLFIINNEVYACANNITKVVVPDSVTKIRKGSFVGCAELTEIIIPQNTPVVEEYDEHDRPSRGWDEVSADYFLDCKKLSVMTALGTDPKVMHDVFLRLLPPFIREQMRELHVHSPSFVPAECKNAAVRGFVHEKPDLTTERAKIHLHAMKAGAKTYIDLALSDPMVLQFMCDNKLIPAKDIEVFIEAAQNKGDVAAISLLMDYQANRITQKEKDNNQKRLEKKDEREFEAAVKRMDERMNVDQKPVNELTISLAGICHRCGRYSDTDFKRFMREKMGVKITDLVHAKVDYLVLDDPQDNPEAYQKAESLGIPVITWDQMLERTGYNKAPWYHGDLDESYMWWYLNRFSWPE